MKTQLVSASVLLVLSGCGTGTSSSPVAGSVSASTPAREAGTVTDATTDQPDVQPLTCSSDVRSGGTIDFFDDTGGQATPEEAARMLAEPSDGIVVEGASESAAVAYLLRANDTTYMRLDLVALRDGTWRVETVESCPGEGLGH